MTYLYFLFLTNEYILAVYSIIVKDILSYDSTKSNLDNKILGSFVILSVLVCYNRDSYV